jgi:hypothetical protein
MDDNEQLTSEQRAQIERFRAHQEQFKERRRRAGFDRWKASMHLTAEAYRARYDRPPQPPVSLPKRS